MAARQYVFGYGSLAATGAPGPTRRLDPAGYVTELIGFARGWGVAMDNRRDLPGYKYYRRRDDGSRPAVFVAFLDVVESAPVMGAESAPGAAAPAAAPAPALAPATVNGVCRPVADDALGALDRRERNYVRVDVTDRLADALGPTWAYVGSPDGRERLGRARADGRAVIGAAYRDAVLAAFAALGPQERAAAEPSLEPGGLPVWELERVELP
jgi:hypothetical protein